jgi:hypothetical protein
MAAARACALSCSQPQSLHILEDLGGGDLGFLILVVLRRGSENPDE